MRSTSTLRRVLMWAGGVLGLATCLTVAIHLGPVRKALGWKPLGAAADAVGETKSGWCPFGFGGTTADGVAVLRPRPHSVVDASKPIAAQRPALGFDLDHTTKAEVLAWVAAHDVTCVPMQGGSTLECTNVPAALLPAGQNTLGLSTVWFSFPFDDKLEIVKTLRNAVDAESVLATLDGQQAALTAQTGAGPVSRRGAKDAGELALGALRQAKFDFEFQNYRAQAEATNMGARGYLVTEMYAAVL